MRALVCVVLIAFAMPARVYAQPADVPALIKVIENQPNDMDRSTWKEKRRDAARKLAQSKDKRAVPVLINLAETETFDIIGDIAIEGLGSLKDQAAVPVLQKIVGDVSRDKSSRDLARKALAKMGAPETGSATGGSGAGSAIGGSTVGTGSGAGSATTATATGGAKTGGTATTTTATTTNGGAKTGGGTTTTTTAAVGSSSDDTSGGETSSGDVSTGLEAGGSAGSASGTGLIGDSQASSDVGGQPALDDDVIAAYDRLTFVIGTAGLSYDTAQDRVDFDANGSGRFQKRIDRERNAYGWDLGADVVAGVINPAGRGVTRGLALNVHGDAEARLYANKIYGIGKTAIGAGFQQFSYRDANDPGDDQVGADARVFTADIQLAIGGGYGRIVDVGAAIRVSRLARLLDNARALGKPIDAATSKRLQLTWWALRGERSSYRSLLATVAILREAGILLGEPNASVTYEILQVLQDTQLYMRPSGFDVQLTVSEGYLKRPTDMNGNCDVICGRVEQIMASAGYGSQLQDDKLELSGNAFARYRLFAGDMNPAPWAVGATARMRRFTYGEHGEAFGAFDVRGTLTASNDDTMMSDTSLRIEGELGFTYWINQASGLRLAATLAEDAGEIFFGARLEATYGLLDGIFAQ